MPKEIYINYYLIWYNHLVETYYISSGADLRNILLAETCAVYTVLCTATILHRQAITSTEITDTRIIV